MHIHSSLLFCFFFFNDPATTEIYTLSLHDALPISPGGRPVPSDATLIGVLAGNPASRLRPAVRAARVGASRSEEHTSELQSQSNLVCRLLLEKKKKNKKVNSQLHEVLTTTFQ